MSVVTAPIGIYDSGLGGLSVLKQLQAQLPRESFIYLADTARVPYGGRNAEEIKRFSLEMIEFLVAQGVKAILCACNSSSVVVLPEHRQYKGIPVLGLAQAGALTAQPYRRVALLATEATVRSGVYREAVLKRFPGVQLQEWACPAFVPLVEFGQWNGSEAELAIADTLAPVKAWAPDAVILGCSHYPYLAPLLQRYLGGQVDLLDPARVLVAQLAERLTRQHAHTPYRRGVGQFYCSAGSERFRLLAESYLGYAIEALNQWVPGAAVHAPAFV